MRKSIHMKTLFFAFSIFLLPSNLPAQEREMLMFMDLDDIVVSAAKRLQPSKDAPAVVTVISEVEIRNMGARNLFDALKRVPGIGVSIVTGYGKFGIESRGIISAFSEKVLLMINGHRVNESIRGTGVWHFGDMTVENIKRVEVIRGPGSALHGANAFVAVINVVTKDAEDIDGIDVRAGAGSFDTSHYNLMMGKKGTKLKIAAMVDYYKTDGAKMHIDQDAAGRSGETDGRAEKTDAALKISYGDFTFNGRYLDKNEGGYIGAVNVLSDENKMDSRYAYGELSYKHSPSKDIQLLIKGYWDYFAWSSFIEILPESLFPPEGMIGIPKVKNRTLGSEVQLDYSIGDNHTLTAGALYEDIKQYDVKQYANFDPNTGDPLLPPGSVQDITSWANWNRNITRYVSAIYVQDVWKVAPEVEATLGVRCDHYSDFGSSTNPRLGLVWSLSEKSRVKLLYGEAFRAPNFVELYNENNPVQRGNPDLDPEKIKTYELSLEQRFGENANAKLAYFNSKITDLIRERKADWRYENLDSAEIEGIEAEFRMNFDKASYGYLNYTYQNPRDRVSGDKLPDVAGHKGNIGFNLSLGGYVNANVNLLMVGKRPRDIDDPREDLDGYEVVDLTLIGKNFYKNLEIRGSVYNLFNERYADPEKYTDPVQRSSLDLLEGDFPREKRMFIIEARYTF